MPPVLAPRPRSRHGRPNPYPAPTGRLSDARRRVQRADRSDGQERPRSAPPRGTAPGATRDLVKDEIRRHLEKVLREDPKLAQDLRDAVRDLLEARAKEYAAVLRVGAAAARLGLSALPPDVRRTLTEDVVKFISQEIGNIAERTL
ncbi:hypothetical protein B1B_19686 [mine drainage metagenome]|uniref:Uncharacterized protein n=1 Tax=mine drainage metagenome TaxID=410659 RepID=T0XSD6_9ZZZZ